MARAGPHGPRDGHDRVYQPGCGEARVDGLAQGQHQGHWYVPASRAKLCEENLKAPNTGRTGITNQRETTLCWSRSTGKPLCNAIVWDDARTNAVVRQFEKKLEEEGIEIDDEDEAEAAAANDEAVPNGHSADHQDTSRPAEGVTMGTGKAESAFAESGKVEAQGEGVAAAMSKAMETLGLAGRGKESSSKKRRKGKAGLVDM